MGTDYNLKADVNSIKNRMQREMRKVVTFAEDIQNQNRINCQFYCAENTFKDPLQNILGLQEQQEKTLFEKMEELKSYDFGKFVEQNPKVQQFLGLKDDE